MALDTYVVDFGKTYIFTVVVLKDKNLCSLQVRCLGREW